VDHRGSVVGGADVAHIRLAEFFGTEAGQQRRKDECEIRFSPIGFDA
jgi:hypothetical protein